MFRKFIKYTLSEIYMLHYMQLMQVPVCDIKYKYIDKNKDKYWIEVAHHKMVVGSSISGVYLFTLHSVKNLYQLVI